MKKILIVFLALVLFGCSLTTPKGVYILDIDENAASMVISSAATLVSVVDAANRAGLMATFTRGNTDKLIISDIRGDIAEVYLDGEKVTGMKDLRSGEIVPLTVLEK